MEVLLTIVGYTALPVIFGGSVPRPPVDVRNHSQHQTTHTVMPHMTMGYLLINVLLGGFVVVWTS